MKWTPPLHIMVYIPYTYGVMCLLHVDCFVSPAHRLLCAPCILSNMCPLHIGVMCPAYRLDSSFSCNMKGDEFSFIYIEVVITIDVAAYIFFYIGSESRTKIHIGTKIHTKTKQKWIVCISSVPTHLKILGYDIVHCC